MYRYEESEIKQLELSDGFTMDIHYWQPEGEINAIFLGLHGGMAHGGDFVTLAKYFLPKQILTVAPDLRGHKEKRVYINRFSQFLEDLEVLLDIFTNEFLDIPIFLVGHSAGALIGLEYTFKKNLPNQIKGLILSSPYLENVIKTPRMLVLLSGILSRVVPKSKIPIEDFTDNLTRDTSITKRHHEDIELGNRASQASMRYGRELFLAQRYVLKQDPSKIKLPMLIFVSGKDLIADAETNLQYFSKLDRAELVFYEENYHENFNELNRDETFAKINDWINNHMK